MWTLSWNWLTAGFITRHAGVTNGTCAHKPSIFGGHVDMNLSIALDRASMQAITFATKIEPEAGSFATWRCLLLLLIMAICACLCFARLALELESGICLSRSTNINITRQ
jgi:hypothetical protein